MRRWAAATLLALSYALLVGIVAVGGYWINQEFEDAHDERCSTTKIALELAKIQVEYVEAQGTATAPDVQSELNHLSFLIDDICP